MRDNHTNEDIQRSLGRLEGKLDLIIERQSEIKDTCETLDGRVTKIENDWSFNRGAMMLAGTCISILVGVVTVFSSTILKWIGIA